MKKLALTTLTACLLAGPTLAAPPLSPEPAASTTILAQCPGKPPVNA